MKKLAKIIILLTLVLALPLAQLACAEPDETIKGIFEALTAEDAGYNFAREIYPEYFPGTVFEETLADDGFTIAISGSEYMDGSWTFTRDGEYLAATIDGEDYSGMTMMLYVIEAVGSYYGINTRLINSYVNGLSALGIESGNFIATEGEAGTTYRVNIAGPWDMKELDAMAFDEASLGHYEPLGEDFASMGGSIGKVMMVANGSANDFTLLLGEYGGLDELAHTSIVNIVNTLQPTGWEDFAANYPGLADAEGEGWSVRLDVDRAEVDGIIDDASDDYSYALVRFGADSFGEGDSEYEEYDFEAPEPAEAPGEEAFRQGYFDVIAGIEPDAAGASLKVAAAASEVCAFAEAWELYNPDIEPMRANMLAAFEAMDEADQERFWQNFDAVLGLLDECLEDYDAHRAVFEDAGVAEAMDEVMYDPLNRLAWRNLRDHTLTMGNDMNAG